MLLRTIISLHLKMSLNFSPLACVSFLGGLKVKIVLDLSLNAAALGSPSFWKFPQAPPSVPHLEGGGGTNASPRVFVRGK